MSCLLSPCARTGGCTVLPHYFFLHYPMTVWGVHLATLLLSHAGCTLCEATRSPALGGVGAAAAAHCRATRPHRPTERRGRKARGRKSQMWGEAAVGDAGQLHCTHLPGGILGPHKLLAKEHPSSTAARPGRPGGASGQSDIGVAPRNGQRQEWVTSADPHTPPSLPHASRTAYSPEATGHSASKKGEPGPSQS